MNMPESRFVDSLHLSPGSSPWIKPIIEVKGFSLADKEKERLS
jgi:hypothetical protein